MIKRCSNHAACGIYWKTYSEDFILLFSHIGIVSSSTYLNAMHKISSHVPMKLFIRMYNFTFVCSSFLHIYIFYFADTLDRVLLINATVKGPLYALIGFLCQHWTLLTAHWVHNCILHTEYSNWHNRVCFMYDIPMYIPDDWLNWLEFQR